MPSLLPHEIYASIFEEVDRADLVVLCITCRSFQDQRLSAFFTTRYTSTAATCEP
ncbi:hypothetical protein B0H10DRAFT_2007703 [Mycena sp. CBHHK59/15]|nr:hypothetical protein B0H10DRAFT_2007703 [Mycena sp. CBHHK59/15]